MKKIKITFTPTSVSKLLLSSMKNKLKKKSLLGEKCKLKIRNIFYLSPETIWNVKT